MRNRAPTFLRFLDALPYSVVGRKARKLVRAVDTTARRMRRQGRSFDSVKRGTAVTGTDEITSESVGSDGANGNTLFTGSKSSIVALPDGLMQFTEAPRPAPVS